MRRVLAFAAILVVLGQTLDAQAVRQQSRFNLSRGAEIRFTIDSLGSAGEVGRVIAVGVDSLYLRRTLLGDSVAIAMQRFIALEVRTTRAHKKAGAFLLAGGFVGLAIAHADYHPTCLNECQSRRDQHKAGGTAAGALIGALAGTITGAFIRTTTWQRMPLLREHR